MLVWFAEGAYVAHARFEPPLRAKPAPNLLWEFVRLSDPDRAPEDVRSFAEKWGVLRLCRHGLPRAHPPMPTAPRGTLFCEDVAGDEFSGREEVIQWLAWTSRFRVVVSLFAAVRKQEAGQPDDWRLLRPDSPPPASVDDASRLLSAEVQKILYVGLVLPIVDVARPRITIRGPGLFGMLAVQLLLLVAGTKALPFCASCRLPYAPERRPTHNRRNYCPDCRGHGWPQRDASYDYRQRKRKTQPNRDCP
jgi:hypothetical protein